MDPSSSPIKIDIECGNWDATMWVSEVDVSGTPTGVLRSYGKEVCPYQDTISVPAGTRGDFEVSCPLCNSPIVVNDVEDWFEPDPDDAYDRARDSAAGL